MTPTMSLVLIFGLVAGLTLLRWPDRQNLRNLPAASKRFVVLVHLSVCLIVAFFVWLFTLSVGTPLSDYLSVLALLGLEGLLGGLISCLFLFSCHILHIPIIRHMKQTEDKEGIVRLNQIGIGRLPPGTKVVYNRGHGRWTAQDHALDEEPNSRIS